MSKILKGPRKQSARKIELWLYLALLTVVFVFGGSSRDDYSGLVLLRPICIVAFFYYLSRLQWHQIKMHVFVLAFSAAILTILLGLKLRVWAESVLLPYKK